MAPESNRRATAVYEYTGAFFDGLVAHGVRHAVLSPGSRSTPLTLAASRCDALRSWVQLDERAAGFFALGLVRATRMPVALVCTSGSAAANYLPAVVEARYARLPLLLLTADRPPELRDWGAGQTIDQQGLYGRHALWYAEAPVAGEAGATAAFAERLAARAIARASGRPAGAVHLNWPFREPLEPPVSGAAPEAAKRVAASADAAQKTALPRAVPSPAPVAPPSIVRPLAERFRRPLRGVIVSGPADEGPEFAAAVSDLARATGWPLLADPTSQLRRGPHVADAPVIAHADLILRDEAFARRMKPEVVFRVGASPTSKTQRLWLEAQRPAEWILVDPDDLWSEPGFAATECLPFDAGALCRDLALEIRALGGIDPNTPWATRFADADRAAADTIERALEKAPGLLEPAAVRAVAEALPEDSILCVANSMPVRDLDAFLPAGRAPLRVLCQRGANGIDGTAAGAIGAAAAERGPVTLLTGDLALLHDVSALEALRRQDLSLVIVVLNNCGGGIFSFLPIAERIEAEEFERLFRTPHQVAFEDVARLYGLAFTRVHDAGALRDAVAGAHASGGAHLVEVPVDRDTNVDHHRALSAAVGLSLRDLESAAGASS